MAVKEWQLKLYQAFPAPLQNLLLSAAGWLKKRKELGPLFHKKFSPYLDREFADAEDLAEIQLQGLRSLLVHVGTNVPFYKKMFAEHGFNPRKVDSTEDLKALPLLTKDIIRENYEDCIFPGHSELKSFKQGTSGTTGKPFSFLIDHNTLIHEKVWIYRHRNRYGYFPGNAWRGTLNGQPIVPVEHSRPPFWRVNKPWKQLLLSGYHLEEKNINLYRDAILRHNIRFLDGYPSILYILARLFREAGINVPMKGVFVGAEPIYDFQRDEIEAVFECPVHDYYGLTEKVTSAGDCEKKQGLHVNVEDSVAEIVDPESGEAITEPGRQGLLVATSLVNYSMPLIRYVTDDQTAWVGTDCSCGRKLPLVEPVYTKVEDVIVTPSGKYISASIITYPFKPVKGIEESQVVQTAPDHVEVRTISNKLFTDDQKNLLISGMNHCLGSDVTVSVREVESIPRTRTGKFRFVVNEAGAGIIKNFGS